MPTHGSMVPTAPPPTPQHVSIDTTEAIAAMKYLPLKLLPIDISNPKPEGSDNITYEETSLHSDYNPTAILETKTEAAAFLLTPPTPEGRDLPSLRPKPNPKTEKLLRKCRGRRNYESLVLSDIPGDSGS